MNWCKQSVCAALLLGLQAAAGAEPERITYADHVLPILRNTCLNCHNPEKHKGGLDLSTYQAAMAGNEDGKVIEPGNVENSLLVKLISHTDEPSMPPKSDKLPDSQIDMIKKWIAGNALENSGSKASQKSAGAVPLIAAESDESTWGGLPPMPRDLVLEPVAHTMRAGAVAGMAASPRAPLLAVTGQKQVLLFNTDTLELAGVLPFPEGFPQVVKFSRDGHLLLAGGGVAARSGRVVLWDVETGERVREIGDEFDAVLAADITADHETVALGGPGKLVKIYSARDGRLLHSIKKHTDWVTAMAFTPDGKLLVSGDRAGNLCVWETAGGRELWTLNGHKGAITGAVCAAGVAVSASEDGTVKVWDLAEGKQMKSWEAHKGGATSVALARDGRLVSCGRDKVARVWDSSGKQLRASEEFSDVALQSAWCGERFVAGDWTGVIRVWNAADGKRAGEVSPNPPMLAERADLASKRIAELQALCSKRVADRALAEAAVKTAEAESQAASLALGENEKRVSAAESRLAAAKNETGRCDAALNKTVASVLPAVVQSVPKTDVGDDTAKIAASDAPENAARDAAATARAELAAVETELSKARGELAAAKALRELKIAAAKAAADHFAQTATAVGESLDQLQAAQREAAKWRAAEVNVRLHAAREKMRAGNPGHDQANAATQAEKLQREYESLQREAGGTVTVTALKKP